MTDETQATVETDGTDTAAVLALSEGRKDYLPEKATAEPEGSTTEAEPEPTGDEPAGDETPAETDEAKAEAPKPKKTAQERFDELTRARREAEREVEFWKAKALQTTPAPAQEAQQTAPSQDDGRPDPSFYELGHTDPQYIEDLTDWKAEAAALRVAERSQQQAAVQTVLQTFEQRTNALFPEGEPEGLQAFKALPTLPEAVIKVVGKSEVGPKIAEYLGDNPHELRRLEAMGDPIDQAYELSLIANRFSVPKAAAVPPPKITNAPEPPPVARGASGRFQVAPDTDDFASFQKQYGMKD